MKKTAWILLIGIFAVQSVFWIVSGTMALTAGSQSTLIALLMIGNGVLFGAFALLCKKALLPVRIGALAFLFVNLVLTVTDQMGAVDIIALILNIIALLSCLYLFISSTASRRKQ